MNEDHSAVEKPSAAEARSDQAGTSLKVVQVKSAIGTRPAHRGTLRALGLGGIGRTNVLPDRPEIRGMIARVPHLVSVTDVSEEPSPRPRPVSRKPRRAATKEAGR